MHGKGSSNINYAVLAAIVVIAALLCFCVFCQIAMWCRRQDATSSYDVHDVHYEAMEGGERAVTDADGEHMDISLDADGEFKASTPIAWDRTFDRGVAEDSAETGTDWSDQSDHSNTAPVQAGALSGTQCLAARFLITRCWG
jgi:hypothetical protein